MKLSPPTTTRSRSPGACPRRSARAAVRSRGAGPLRRTSSARSSGRDGSCARDTLAAAGRAVSLSGDEARAREALVAAFETSGLAPPDPGPPRRRPVWEAAVSDRIAEAPGTRESARASRSAPVSRRRAERAEIRRSGAQRHAGDTGSTSPISRSATASRESSRFRCWNTWIGSG